MIRWERLGALIVPVVVIAALACLVRAAFMFGERWGWAGLAGALFFVAFVLDKPSTPDHDDQQTQALPGRGAVR